LLAELTSKSGGVRAVCCRVSQLRATKLFASYTMGVSRNFSQRGHDGQAPWKEASRGEAGIFRVGIE